MNTFAERLLGWYDHHGRRDLPWQHPRDPYRIWVAEIMLQQTQVATVIPYFERFTTRFPDVATLAAARLDEVLHLWTGLGYYARARNLHAAAQRICAVHGGAFPRRLDTVASLPGIGRSTAGAILAFAYRQRHAILDGNVKRVLARHRRVAGWPGHRAVEKELWTVAETLTPRTRVRDYNQAIMDLGATGCRRVRPRCDDCPLAGDCLANEHGDPHRYPGRAPKRERPRRAVQMIMIRRGAHEVLLERRPPAGIWGGLWGFPECADSEDVARHVDARHGLRVVPQAPWPALDHGFTHFDLRITPVPARLLGNGARIMERDDAVWYNLAEPDARGLAAPVKRLLDKLR
jgi:A/G-specific adenine glycosylase